MGRSRPKAPSLSLPAASHTSTSIGYPSPPDSALAAVPPLWSLSSDHATAPAVFPFASVAAAAPPTGNRLPSRPPSRELTRLQLHGLRLRERQLSPSMPLARAAMPGFRTSAAFFASLRTNLRLHASPPPSPLSTPTSLKGSVSSLSPPSPLPTPIYLDMESSSQTMTTEIPNDVPELHTYITSDVNEKVDALKLVADSIAQQRQAANSALIFNPLNLAVAVGFLAVLSRTLLEYGFDRVMVFVTGIGIVMSMFAACRIFTQKYINDAEALNLDYLDKTDVFITKFGNEVIGTALVEWQASDSKAKRSKKASQGVVKAWTVRLRFRNKSVGSGLLEDAVAEAKKKGAESLIFADDHANSRRPLFKMYNGAMDRREEKSRALLANMWEERGTKK